jgi:hypothetical protein
MGYIFEHDEIRILTKSCEHYAAEQQLVVQQRNHSGFPNQGKLTTLAVRRVIREGKEECQIEIVIEAFGKKRNTASYSSFVMPAEIADKFAEAVLNLQRKG